MINNILDDVIGSLLEGNLDLIKQSSIITIINKLATDMIKYNIYNDDTEKIIFISNILYNNSVMNLLPLDDGVYDLLLELCMRNNPQFKVGAPPIQFDDTTDIINNNHIITNPFIISDKEILYYDQLAKNNANTLITEGKKIIPFTVTKEDNTPKTISKRITNTTHTYKELVGTLSKCKFVMNYQAEEKGVLNEPNVRVLERDFFGAHITQGILDPNRRITVVAELKYDGISVEGDVSSIIHEARTRGDANEGVAADLTPIFKGYPFNNIIGKIPDNDRFGVKFEAIITIPNLLKFNKRKGKEYKNCRTGIVGLLGGGDAPDHADLVTLVPLASSLGNDRITDIEFLNKYYANEEGVRYVVASGTYVEVLYQIKLFTEEAEYMRPYLPFMYDGIVVSYTEPDIIEKLGRVNSVNLYSTAVKFNSLKRLSRVRNVSYTIGQNGVITPMIHYDPVEFFGTIHDKSSLHSYDRFTRISARYDDILEIEYVGDVMPYVNKPINSHNTNNENPVFEFVTKCPWCDTLLEESSTGKSIYCRNQDCSGKAIARVVNMVKKLNLKDFAESNLEEVGSRSFKELIETTMGDLDKTTLGPKMKEKFMERLEELKTKKYKEYELVGSLGFTNIAKDTWKKIFKEYTLNEILTMYDADVNVLITNLANIKYIGSLTAQTIAEEFYYFKDDLVYISQMPNVIANKYLKESGKKIRFSGFRNSDLVQRLNDLGHDVDDNKSITKDTDILLIPTKDYTSTKIDTALRYGNIKIITIDEFESNMNDLLNI